MVQKFFAGVFRLLYIFPCLNLISVMLSWRVGNFWHDPWTQHKISGLGLKGLTRLIKWVKLGLTYIILYICIDKTQIRHATFRPGNFLYNSRTQHKISGLGLNGLTRLIKGVGSRRRLNSIRKNKLPPVVLGILLAIDNQPKHNHLPSAHCTEWCQVGSPFPLMQVDFFYATRIL